MADDASFYFDPICPFTWLTSRWLRDVTEPRGHTIGWRMMSLKLLNEGKEQPEQYRAMTEYSIRPVRVFQTTLERHGSGALDRLYTEFGRRRHEQGVQLNDELLVAAIDAAGLPDDLIRAADDESIDATIRRSHDDGQARVGEEAGSPIIVIGDGPGFFGPVVSAVPAGEAGEKLYDAVRLMSAVPEFAELKRGRS